MVKGNRSAACYQYQPSCLRISTSALYLLFWYISATFTRSPLAICSVSVDVPEL